MPRLAASDEAHLRHTLWVTRIHRWIAHEMIASEQRSGRRLRAEVRQTVARARLLQRRARWLVRTRKSLPQIVRA